MAFLFGDFFDAEITVKRRCAKKTRHVAFVYMCRFFDAECAEERSIAKKICRVAFAALCSFAHFASIF